MSLFGEPLPFEDETAASLIRRSGYPPEGTYDQMPEVYLCPCCSEFSKQQERDRLLREARDAKEAERRRLLQLDVFDERAKPLPSGDSRRKAYRRVVEDEPSDMGPTVPLPPPTLDDLRRARKDQNVPKLVVTVHHGKNVSAGAEDPISVLVRCGAFEGETAKVSRGKDMSTPWEELFEFPYMNETEPLEVLVKNDTLPPSTEQLLGGVVVPSHALHDPSRGEMEPLPVMPENEMRSGFEQFQEGPLGTIVVSWYVRSGDDKLDESALEKETLDEPMACTFVVHRVFQYTDHGAELLPEGVLCVLRDTDNNCSDSVLYNPGSQLEPSLSPYYAKEGYHYHPENPSQIMQLDTEKKLGHILLCVPKQEENPVDQTEELLVIGAVPLDFERLYHKGSAVLLIESKSAEDALWGEISVEWSNRPLSEEDPHPETLDIQREALFITVVRGLNLSRRDGEPVEEGYVSVANGEMEGTTAVAPKGDDEEGNHVINWNQDIRFMDVDPNEHKLEVQAFEDGRLISVGDCELDDKDEGVVVIEMHNAAKPDDYAGEIVVSYKRHHAPRTEEEPAPMEEYLGEDEEDEEEEEKEEVAVEEEEEPADEEDEEVEEVEEIHREPTPAEEELEEDEEPEEEEDEQPQEEEPEEEEEEHHQPEEEQPEEEQPEEEQPEEEQPEEEQPVEEQEVEEPVPEPEEEAMEEEPVPEPEEEEEEPKEDEPVPEPAAEQREAEEDAEEDVDDSAYVVPDQAQTRRRVSWKAADGGNRYKQPWYPSGSPVSEQHIPFEKTKLSKTNTENIRNLQTHRDRLVEESVRRASTPRRRSSSSSTPRGSQQ